MQKKFDCNETQICHHACGCLRISSMTNDSSTADNVTSSYIAETCSISMNAVLTSQGINYCSIFSFLNLIDLQRYFCHLVISFFFQQLLTEHSMLHNKKKVCAQKHVYYKLFYLFTYTCIRMYHEYFYILLLKSLRCQ